MERLVGQAGRRGTGRGRQFRVDLVVHPGLAHLRHRGARQRGEVPVHQLGGRPGVVDAVADPTGREPVVVDPTGVTGGEQVVGRAHGGDGRQVRWIRARRGELGQSRVADAHHADVMVRHPVLVGHDLDGVVGVVVGRVAEEVEGAPRASGAAHLEADRGEPGHAGEHGAHVGGAVGQQVRVTAPGTRRAEGLGEKAGDRIGGAGRGVPRILDDRRARGRGRAGDAVGVAHGGRQLDAVPHGDVVEPLVHGLVGVQGRIGGRIRPRGEHREGGGGLAAGGVVPCVPRPRRQTPDDQRPEGVGLSGRAGDPGHGGAVVLQGDRVTGTGPREPRLLDRAAGVQLVGGGRGGRWAVGDQGRGHPQQGHAEGGHGDPG